MQAINILDNIQFTFIDQISAKLSILQNSSIKILSIIASIEIAMFGILLIFNHSDLAIDLLSKLIILLC